MRPKSQYRAICCGCERPVPSGEGVLIGKDPYLRRWMVRCQPCERLSSAEKPQPVAAGSFDEPVEDEA